MRPIRLILACALGALSLSGGAAVARKEPAPPRAPASQDQVTTIGVWQPPAGLQQIPIWPGAGVEAHGQPPESVLTARTPEALGGQTSQAVFDVSTPTMTIFPPKGRNTGAAVIVMPGGGFKAVVLTLEGTEICDWLTAKGITCVLLKYRVPKSDQYWDAQCKCHITPAVPLALQDAQRTVRLVRSRAKALNIDPGKIGVMGFSAGGYMAARASNIFEPAYKPVDDIDKISSRPDFAVLLYPGHLCREGGALDPTIHVTKRTSPTFLLAAWDDPTDEVCNSTVYAQALEAGGAQAEVHLFARGGHAFGLRHPDQRVGMWPSLVEGWLKEIGIL